MARSSTPGRVATPSPGTPPTTRSGRRSTTSRVPVSLHYALGGARRPSPPSGIAPGLKPPMADAALPLVASGVFDRFPNVKMVLAHGDAGWAFHWMEFMDINYVRHRHLGEYALPDPEALPSEYIRKYSWFTFHQDRTSVKNRHKLGAAHLMWASHFPLRGRQLARRPPAGHAGHRRGTDRGQAGSAGRTTWPACTGSAATRRGSPTARSRRFEQLVHF